MQITSKRASGVSLTALAVSVVFFLGTLILSKVTGLFCLYALSWQILASVVIWAVLTVQFYQKQLAEQEKLDLAELAGRKEGDTIFESQDSHAELFAVAQKRLRIFEKWFLPAFSIFLAAYEIVIGLYLLNLVRGGFVDQQGRSLLLGAVLSVAVAFLSFLFSLFATGMSSEPKWRPLRAGGNCLLATAILAFLIAVAMALGQFKIFVVLNILNWVVPSVIILMGIETALNFLLDLYRPRIEGRYVSSAFDSRLLATIAAPGNILHTAASAIDYQFGFKVSQTWFYKLMEKAIVPLLIVLAVVLYALSCIVIVGPSEEAIVEHLGKAMNEAGEVRLVGSGLTFKLPWPFEIAYKYPSKRIQQINVGYVLDENERGRQPLLWGQEHYKKEYNLLVASESKDSQEQGAVPVSIIRAAIPVQYRVSDLYKYLYNYENSARVLESICYREVIKFAAGARVEPESESGISEESLLGAGRARAAAELTEMIQRRADEMGLGVEIVFMGLQGFHPPPEVAEDFQAVTGSVQKKHSSVLLAISERDRLLTSNVGSVKAANKLYELAEKYALAKRQKNNAEMEILKAQLDGSFSQAQGDLYAKLRQAKSYAYEKTVLAESTGQRFSGQLSAYNAAGRIYLHELKMGMLEEALADIRKHIVVSDGDTQVTIIDLQEKLMPGLYDIGAVGEK